MKTSDEIRKEIEILEARLVCLRVQLIEAKKKECPSCSVCSDPNRHEMWFCRCEHSRSSMEDLCSRQSANF